LHAAPADAERLRRLSHGQWACHAVIVAPLPQIRIGGRRIPSFSTRKLWQTCYS
jgi:hypothetical protein